MEHDINKVEARISELEERLTECEYTETPEMVDYAQAKKRLEQDDTDWEELQKLRKHRDVLLFFAKNPTN